MRRYEMRVLHLILTTALLASSSTVLAKDKSNDIPVATEAGQAVSCIPIRSIQESRVRSDGIIDFRVSGKKWYRNTLPYSCPSLKFEEAFSYSTSLSQLCSVDIIRVLRNSGSHLDSGASCGLGKFQPVEIARR
jgi:hypothetical protein